MSRERDLLERWVMQNNFEEYCALRGETMASLAQPEQNPLSEDEIDKAYQDSCRNYYDLAFKDGVRFAEQHYGITGVENEEI